MNTPTNIDSLNVNSFNNAALRSFAAPASLEKMADVPLPVNGQTGPKEDFVAGPKTQEGLMRDRSDSYSTGQSAEQVRQKKEADKDANITQQILKLSLQEFESKMDDIISGYDDTFNTIEQIIEDAQAELKELEQIKPVELSDGSVVYLDETSGQFVKMGENGNTQTLTEEEQAEAQSKAQGHNGPVRTVANQLRSMDLTAIILQAKTMLIEGRGYQQSAIDDRNNSANKTPAQLGATYNNNLNTFNNFNQRANNLGKQLYNHTQENKAAITPNKAAYINDAPEKEENINVTALDMEQSDYEIPSFDSGSFVADNNDLSQNKGSQDIGAIQSKVDLSCSFSNACTPKEVVQTTKDVPKPEINRILEASVIT